MDRIKHNFTKERFDILDLIKQLFEQHDFNTKMKVLFFFFAISKYKYLQEWGQLKAGLTEEAIVFLGITDVNTCRHQWAKVGAKRWLWL